MMRIAHLLAFLLSLGFATSGARAQSSTTPETLDLAKRSLAGPIAETTTGAVLLAATPIVGGIVALAAGPGVTLGCEDWFSGEVDEECEASERREQERGRRVAIGVAVPLGLLSAGLLAHGAYRIRRIKQARRAVALELSGLELHRRGGALTLRMAF